MNPKQYDIFSNGIKQALANKIQSKIFIYCFSNNKSVWFPAFVTDYVDGFTSNWNTTEVYGKMDPIATFKNTVRTISLSFDVPSNDLITAAKNATSIDNIIEGLYPIYTSDLYGISTLSSPPLFRVKFANFIENAGFAQGSSHEYDENNNSGLLCYFRNFDFKPDMAQGVLEVDNRIYPKLIKVSLSLNVIHEHALGQQRLGNNIYPRVSINASTFSHRFGASKSSAEVQEAMKKHSEALKQLQGNTETGLPVKGAPVAGTAQDTASAPVDPQGDPNKPKGSASAKTESEDNEKSGQDKKEKQDKKKADAGKPVNGNQTSQKPNTTIDSEKIPWVQTGKEKSAQAIRNAQRYEIAHSTEQFYNFRKSPLFEERRQLYLRGFTPTKYEVVNFDEGESF